jgi:hypothetical protein
MKSMGQNAELLAVKAGGTYIQLPLGFTSLTKMFYKFDVSSRTVVFNRGYAKTS